MSFGFPQSGFPGPSDASDPRAAVPPVAPGPATGAVPTTTGAVPAGTATDGQTSGPGGAGGPAQPVPAPDPYANIPQRGAVDLSVLNRPVAPPPGAPGGAPVASGYVIDLTEANFPEVVQASTQYPVLVLLWMPTDKANADLAITLDALATEFAGRFLLARADVTTQSQIAAAFQVEGVPMVVALLAGQPLPLFAGAAAATDIRPVLDQVLQAAEQNGISGRAPLNGVPQEVPEQPVEPPLPPLHQAAYDALELGDLAGAATAYEQALKQNPHDDMATAGLAQVHLMQRAGTADPTEVRAAAAARPGDVDSALAVADLDLYDGHLDDAFGRLLELLPGADAETKEAVRVRLIEYFNLVGTSDPRVNKARQKLSLYLY
ncbi:MAG: tetratricopeptide repeat protein [Promicromonosporaceae bacterium]|nr:tetratricopeptide repeat protein [Promicromonosporaceae bacterium]